MNRNSGVINRKGRAVLVALVSVLGLLTPGVAVAADTATASDIAQLHTDVEALQQHEQSTQVTRHWLIERDTHSRAAAAKCTNGALLNYATNLTKNWTEEEQNTAGQLSNVIWSYAAIASDKEPQIFGTDGRYTGQANTVMNKLRSFWDIESWDVQLLPAHGADASDLAKMTKLYRTVYDPEKAAAAAKNTVKVANSFRYYDHGRNPFFTLNAFASATENPATGLLTDKTIVLGDGVLDVSAILSYGDVAVPGIVGHEFGHQNQFANPAGIPSNATSVFVELNADAFSGYFVSHQKGLSFDPRRQQQTRYLIGAVGDCFNSHGTPAQRNAATKWGMDTYAAQAKPARILPTADFLARWAKHYQPALAS